MLLRRGLTYIQLDLVFIEIVPDRKVLNFLAGNALDPVWVGEVWREVVEFVRPNH